MTRGASDRIERIVFARLADAGVYDLFLVLATLGAELRRQINVLESPPTNNVQTQYVVEVA